MTSALRNFPATEPAEATGSSRALDELCINTLRSLAMDEVEQAKPGHPGLQLGAAPMAYVLWTRFLSHNPRDSSWPNRNILFPRAIEMEQTRVYLDGCPLLHFPLEGGSPG